MTNLKDIIFIINPNSGKKKISSILKQIKNFDNELSYFITKSEKDFKNFVSENNKKYKVFVIVGGDGTVNSAVDIFYNYPENKLAIIPAGSGNGFAIELGFKKNIKSLIDDILKDETVEIDVLQANGEKFINLFGLGFDSYVAHDFARRKKRGLRNYIRSITKSIFKYKPIEAELKFADKTISGKFNMIIVANTKQFGNNAYIAPFAKPNNGFYDLVLIKPFPVFIYPFFLIRMMTGKLKSSKYITYLKLKNDLTIKTSFTKYHIDGEPRDSTDIINLKKLENIIKFIKTTKCRI